MSSSKDLSKRYAAAVERKGLTNVECAACGRTTWHIQSGRVLLLTGDAAGIDFNDPQGVSASPIICRNCGFIRLHATRILCDEGST